MARVKITLHLGRVWRWGLFATVFDLGAIATIRFAFEDDEHDDTEDEPEVRFEQVFAPGMYLYFGYKPFNLGLGGSFVPSLRPTSDEAAESEPLNVLRAGLFLAVDVSVLPILLSHRRKPSSNR